LSSSHDVDVRSIIDNGDKKCTDRLANSNCLTTAFRVGSTTMTPTAAAEPPAPIRAAAASSPAAEENDDDDALVVPCRSHPVKYRIVFGRRAIDTPHGKSSSTILSPPSHLHSSHSHYVFIIRLSHNCTRFLKYRTISRYEFNPIGAS
jgi:hypothetical protein